MGLKECSWPHCGKKVESWRWGCGSHWHMLPSHLQKKITLGMQGVDSEVREWIVATFGAEMRQEYNPGRWETLVRMVRTRDEARARRRAAREGEQVCESDR